MSNQEWCPDCREPLQVTDTTISCPACNSTREKPSEWTDIEPDRCKWYWIAIPPFDLFDTAVYFTYSSRTNGEVCAKKVSATRHSVGQSWARLRKRGAVRSKQAIQMPSEPGS